MKVSFQSHLEYIRQLRRVAEKYPDMMPRKGKKGRTILRAGSSYKHYRYLRNGSIFGGLAGGREVRPGTRANEAEHRTLKGWTECVYPQHEDRLRAIGDLHGLYRLVVQAVPGRGCHRGWGLAEAAVG